MATLKCPRCRGTQIVVRRRHVSYSAFNGYRAAWSAFCWVLCKKCPYMWKTKSRLADKLPDDKER